MDDRSFRFGDHGRYPALEIRSRMEPDAIFDSFPADHHRNRRIACFVRNALDSNHVLYFLRDNSGVAGTDFSAFSEH